MSSYLLDPQAVAHRSHFPGSQIQMNRSNMAILGRVRRQAALTPCPSPGGRGEIGQPLEPRGLVQAKLNGKRLVQVVVDHGRHGHFIAAGQADRQVQFNEEGLEDADRRFCPAELAVGRNGTRRQPPGGDRIGQVDRKAGPAVVVGDQLGPPEERLGEPLPHAGRRSGGLRSCGRTLDPGLVGGLQAPCQAAEILFMALARRPDSLALCTAGSISATSMPMTVITTKAVTRLLPSDRRNSTKTTNPAKIPSPTQIAVNCSSRSLRISSTSCAFLG